MGLGDYASGGQRTCPFAIPILSMQGIRRKLAAPQAIKPLRGLEWRRQSNTTHEWDCKGPSPFARRSILFLSPLKPSATATTSRQSP
jgi:hypothetical protein